MPISTARQTAYRILRRVESGRDFAVDLLQSPQVSELKEADRRLATQIVMGTLRLRGELDYWLEKHSGKKLDYFDPEVATILRLGLYQILFLQRIPKSAAVNESVELVKAARKRSAAGLVNAVLRKAEPLHEGGRGGKREGKTEAAQIVRSLPAWLAERWVKHFGEDGMKSLANASLQVPPTTLRIAGGLVGRAEIQKQLVEQGIATRLGKYSNQALVVESGNVQASPILRDGRALLQDEASQLVASLVAPHAGDRVLDLCAAPGIKTGLLAMTLREGLLVACDLSARRLRTMPSLLYRTIPETVHVLPVRMDAAQDICFSITFDRILLDAPCSGTGTLARNPEIKWRLQPKDIVRLAELQAKMLHNALQALTPGGRLVYVTCSLEPEENEQVVENVLKNSQGFRSLPPSGITVEFPSLTPLFDSNGYFHTRPDLHAMDGFFAAIIHRMPL